MSLHSPLAFLMLIPLIAVLVWVFFRRQKMRASVQFASVQILKRIPPSLKARLSFLPFALKTFAVLLMIYALARPQQADTKVRKNVEGIDIIIALDISDSMLIEDMKPTNRIESAKATIKEFIAKRTTDRIGLVVFAGEAFTMVPPTLDYQLVLERAGQMTTAANANIKDGTALGVAMASAAARLKDSTAKNRVIIFLTDGENNSGTIDPETGLSIAKGYGLKVYSIGIGKDGPTRIPIYSRDIYGEKIKTYQPFESRVNEDLLQRMALETGGKYFRAEKEDSLKKVFDEIDQLEKTKIEVNKFTKYDELFARYLWFALMLYLLSFGLEQTALRRQP